MQVQHSGSQTVVFDQVDAILHSPEAVQTFIREQFDRTSEYRPSRAMRLCLKLITHIKIGQLDVILPDHRVLRFGGKADGPQALLRIHNDRFARRFMIGGQLAFCEAYLDGDWSSPDLAAFFESIRRVIMTVCITFRHPGWVAGNRSGINGLKVPVDHR